MTPRRTFDEARDTPRVCPCGRHIVTGAWSSFYCPWARPSGLWVQPDDDPLAE